jgi:hypothetical protein
MGDRWRDRDQLAFNADVTVFAKSRALHGIGGRGASTGLGGTHDTVSRVDDRGDTREGGRLLTCSKV